MATENWYEDDLDSTSEGTAAAAMYDITSTPNDFNIGTLFNMMDSGIIKIPGFQRNYVWNKRRASRLIESIMLGLPVPQVFLYGQGDEYIVIDGQQRLLSIYFFMKQRFPRDAVRTSLKTEFNGRINEQLLENNEFFTDFTLDIDNELLNKKKFKTLDPEKQNLFQYMRTLRSIVIRQNSPEDDDSSMHEIFNRLNTGGQNLTDQEIRSSLFFSKFLDMLAEINDNTKWRKILHSPKANIRSKDIEFLLRGFAILLYREQYTEPMSRFLNKYAKKASQYSDSQISYLRELFNSFLSACANLDSKAFCTTTGKFNVTLFDSVFTAICSPCIKHDSLAAKRLVAGRIDKASLANLKKNDEFKVLTQSKTGNKKRIAARIALAEEMIKIQED